MEEQTIFMLNRHVQTNGLIIKFGVRTVRMFQVFFKRLAYLFYHGCDTFHVLKPPIENVAVYQIRTLEYGRN